MDELDRILRVESEQLELLLCRLTALRTLVASGDAPLVPRAVRDVEDAARAVDEAEERRRAVVAEMGMSRSTLAEIAEAAEPGYEELMSGHRDRLVGMERRLRQASRQVAVAAQKSLERVDVARLRGEGTDSPAAAAYGRSSGPGAAPGGQGRMLQGAL